MLQRITLITEDRPGLLAHVTALLGEKQIDIKSVVADSLQGSAVLHIDLEQADEALAVLAAAGYNAVTNEVLLVRVEDRPGALARLSQRLLDAGIAIRALNMLRRNDGWAVVAVSTYDNAAARTMLESELLGR